MGKSGLPIRPSPTCRKRRIRQERKTATAPRSERVSRGTREFAGPCCWHPIRPGSPLEIHVQDATPLGWMIDPDRIGVGGHAFGPIPLYVWPEDPVPHGVDEFLSTTWTASNGCGLRFAEPTTLATPATCVSVQQKRTRVIKKPRSMPLPPHSGLHILRGKNC